MSLFDRFPFMSLAVAAVLAGCGGGPEIGDVTGTVRVNGQPLPYAYVVFQPVDPPGAYGSAYTDKDGRYRLQFSPSRHGAPVGRHQVSIRPAGRDELPGDAPPSARVRLPERFNSASELFRDVKPGENVHDFELALPFIASTHR
jgi:hypothetical protein